MKKILISIVVIIAIIVGGLVVGRNILARTIIIKGIKATTGMDIDVGRIQIGLTQPGILVSGLKIYNPQGFSDRLLADIPEIYVDLDLAGLFKNFVHMRMIKIDINEFNVVLNEKGKLNVNSLALLMPKPGTGKAPEVKIDILNIKIGKVAYRGYFPAVGAKSQEFNMALDETFKEVTNPSAVAGDIVKKILKRIGIGNLANFDVSGQVAQAKEQVSKTVSGIADEAKGSLKSIFSK